MTTHSQVLIVGGGPVGLVLSKLLRRFGVQCTLLERRLGLRNHPQAHYINTRTMEIMRSFCWQDYVKSLQATSASVSWRDFVYCSTVTDADHYLREDQFQRTDPAFWSASPTANIHLAQSVFESILMHDHIASSSNSANSGHIRLGHEVKGVSFDPHLVTAEVRRPDGSMTTLSADYLVVCDGAHSRVRSMLGIETEGKRALQHLMNVHFCCPGLRVLLAERTAMLYFVFNQAMVAVYVSHDPDKDEWICQIPYFPPFQSPEDFSERHVRNLLEQTLFGSKGSTLSKGIQIRAINNWVMHAEVAKHYVEPTCGRIFLAGDAAHRFPPAGGFGMNTGIQDAHNLAWKLTHAIQGQASRQWLGKSYENERRKLARDNTKFAMRNYARSTAAAQALGLDPALAEKARDIAGSTLLGFVPEIVRKHAFLSALKVGLQSLTFLEAWRTNLYGNLRVKALNKLSATKQTLPLVFPEHDVGFSYVEGAGPWQAGRRLKHLWLLLAPSQHFQFMQDAMVIVSTVDLPSVAQSVVHQSLPPLVVLTRDSILREQLVSMLQAAKVNMQSIVFVLVHPCQEHHCQSVVKDLLATDSHLSPPSAATLSQHKILQAHLQIPRFDTHIPSTAAPSKAALLQHHDNELRNLGTVNSQRLTKLLGGAKSDQGCFHELLNVAHGVQHIHATFLSNDVLNMPTLLAVRPDGHIASSFTECTDDHLRKFCFDISRALGGDADVS